MVTEHRPVAEVGEGVTVKSNMRVIFVMMEQFYHLILALSTGICTCPKFIEL